MARALENPILIDKCPEVKKIFVFEGDTSLCPSDSISHSCLDPMFPKKKIQEKENLNIGINLRNMLRIMEICDINVRFAKIKPIQNLHQHQRWQYTLKNAWKSANINKK